MNTENYSCIHCSNVTDRVHAPDDRRVTTAPSGPLITRMLVHHLSRPVKITHSVQSGLCWSSQFEEILVSYMFHVSNYLKYVPVTNYSVYAKRVMLGLYCGPNQVRCCVLTKYNYFFGFVDIVSPVNEGINKAAVRLWNLSPKITFF